MDAKVSAALYTVCLLLVHPATSLSLAHTRLSLRSKLSPTYAIDNY